MEGVTSLAENRGERGRVAAKVAATAVPSLILGAVVPALCFLVGRRVWGLGGAICLALVWNGCCQAGRRLRGKPLSGLLIIGLLELGLRGSVALALNSAKLFFVVPAIVTAVSGGVFVVCGLTSTPLISAVVADLVPDSVLDVIDPRVTVLLRKVSVLYGAEQVLVAIVSIAMAMNLSTATYVTIHVVVSWAVLGIVIAAAAPFLGGELRAVVRGEHGALAAEAAVAFDRF